MSQEPQLIATGAPSDPPSGLTYPLALRLRGSSPFQAVFGILVAFSAFALLVPLFSELVLRVAHLVRGGGDYAAYRQQAGAYELAEGPAAGHLALALLIPVSILIVRYIHGVRPRWLFSVQPGLRWRYLAIMLVVAALALNGVLWLSFLAKGAPVFHGGQDGWLTFLLVVAVTSPLQTAAEEVFFRGYLLQAIGSASGRTWVGVVGSAVLFALLHGVQNPALFAHRLAFGLIAGALVVVTGGLEAGIAAHVVNNIAAYAYAMFTTSVAELRAITALSWADAGWDILGFLTVALLAILLARRLRMAAATP
ncbi:CPBP family intramembrane glutamic endopeptidase [Tessaracoccus flavus]|uniref:CAAX prenyl protease 2/Lysostaphin resistance protein A-like domain-containing protein n=1 Tax=Tessaracoccus flavus TaxID=1610493 RepID=A0A1Q2CF43_9ACTN|nr:CPBP family intramembrane glutamic endopeptidase [Tessaracoccus flavus]AQP44742.1 hypothetical protein RPIT_07930 [Tessaracoccus flavus]SDZ16483.1 hypothetical protein SAMN05428934_11326 [Tessaracoccus flavus]